MGMRSGDGRSRYARGGPDLGQTVRLNHISKMVLSIVKFGGLSALLEAVALPVHLQDVNSVSEAVQQGAGQPLRAEHLGPLVEGQVGGD